MTKHNNDSTNDRLSRLRTCANLQKRASLASAWKILLASEDQNDLYTLPMQDQETIERLANTGYYKRAIFLAQIVTCASTNARNYFNSVYCFNFSKIRFFASPPVPSSVTCLLLRR
mmetsp:Transcript_4209/g.4338  ORF Transcript_4209/g.4338 Transcript_4209/m.4338 type:complete len:116 (+) Transcript_4209:50-397(+)